MTPQRITELKAKVIEIIIQEARLFAACGHFDDVENDEEVDFIRWELRRQADNLDRALRLHKAKVYL